MKTLFFFSSLFLSSLGLTAQIEKPLLNLWYKQPANEWMKAIPIGNGRLGAMIYGCLKQERIGMNEITMWTGQVDPNQELAGGKEKLAKIRKLFFDGKLEEGNNEAIKAFSGKPNTFGTHIPVGELKLNFDCDTSNISEYKRDLNLENAIATVSYKLKNVSYKREYFSSNPDDVIVIRLTADTQKSITFSLSLDLLSRVDVITTKKSLTFTGKATSELKVNGFPDFSKGGVDFIGKINVLIVGGHTERNNGLLKIVAADEAILTIDIRTNYNNPNYKAICERTIKHAASKSYDQIVKDHIEDYNNLFSRVDLNFGKNETEKLPTDERLAQFRNGKDDPGLPALFMQYGRYLLISCSRWNSPLPANLQGLWNDNLACNMPWTCDYHLDINTQQNYWAANVGNLPECNSPLFNYIDYLARSGEETAKKVYGSPGWVAHTVTNVWGYTAPGEWPGWGLFPTASTWIASHLWEHYLFTKDLVFLKNKAYPILKKNAEFFIDYMVENPNNGYLMTGPSTSPENVFGYQGKALSLSMMPTCDRVFVHELFSACIASSEILNIDQDFCNILKTALKKLPPIKIGKNGTIQEWFDDYDIIQPSHRHATHLTALYPYSQISLNRTPELARAAKKTIDDKLLSPGWEDVEWSRGNIINFYARLKEPALAYKSVSTLLKNLTRDNLFTISVGGIAGAATDIFAFDGNESGASGIAEMLIQSHEGYIDFLPALPQEWQNGYFKGLCVREGTTVDAYWENGKLQKARLKAYVSNNFYIKLNEGQKARFILNGKVVQQSCNDNISSIKMKKDDNLEIMF